MRRSTINLTRCRSKSLWKAQSYSDALFRTHHSMALMSSLSLAHTKITVRRKLVSRDWVAVKVRRFSVRSLSSPKAKLESTTSLSSSSKRHLQMQMEKCCTLRMATSIRTHSSKRSSSRMTSMKSEARLTNELCKRRSLLPKASSSCNLMATVRGSRRACCSSKVQVRVKLHKIVKSMRIN